MQHVSAGIIFVISFHRSYLLASVITSEYYLFSGRLNKYGRDQAGCTAQAVWGTIQRRISPATVVSRGKTHPGEVLMLRTAGFEIPGAKVENVQRTFAIERRRRVRWSCSGFFAKKKKKKHHGIKTAILEIIWDSSLTSWLCVRPLVRISLHVLNQIA